MKYPRPTPYGQAPANKPLPGQMGRQPVFGYDPNRQIIPGTPDTVPALNIGVDARGPFQPNATPGRDPRAGMTLGSVYNPGVQPPAMNFGMTRGFGQQRMRRPVPPPAPWSGTINGRNDAR